MPTLWTLLHPKATYASLGYIPQFLNVDDPRPAKEQFQTNYIGGWNPFQGFQKTPQGLKYPGDPLMVLIASTQLRQETITFYDGAWVAITQPDGSYEISRMD